MSAVETPAPRLSIVSTLFGSAAFLPAFVAECRAAARDAGVEDWELVLVNDGSPDDSLAIARAQRELDPRIVVVDLSRNFGHHAAMHAGLCHARGERVFLIDCDLEVRPAVLGVLLERLEATGADLVYGYQEARKGGRFERWSGGLFWRALNAVSEVPIPENMLTERVMTRRFVDALTSLGDHNMFLGGMMSWTGFVQIGVPLRKAQREGRSSYTVGRRLQLMVTAVSAFSSRPLALLFHAGALIAGLASVFVAGIVVRHFWVGGSSTAAFLLAGIAVLALGIQLMGLGLVGVYLGKVYDQVRQRPRYIVRDIFR